MRVDFKIPKKILIVDDVADNIVLLKQMLEFFSSDYNIYSAGSAKEAMVQIVSVLPDVIILDIRIPNIDGFIIRKWVRQNTNLPYIPILFLTAQAFSLNDKIKGFECGCDDYMTKPFEKDELYMRIKSILKFKSLHDELYEKNNHLESLLQSRTKALNESEIKYETLVEGAAEGVIIIQDEKIRFANMAFQKMLDFPINEVINCFFSDFVHPDDQIILQENILFLVLEKRSVFYEIKIVRKDSSVLHTEASVSKLEYDGHEAVMIILRDITDRKNAQEQASVYEKQLIQADKMKSLGIMVSGVAHEINNPNNFILLNSQTLNEIFDKMLAIIDECYKNCKEFTIGTLSYSRVRGKIPELLDGIVEGSTRIRRIVKQLKDFARTNVSGYTQPVAINDVVEAAITITDNLIKKSTAIFSVDYGGSIPLIKGNRQELEQVVINLLTNSCESLLSRDKSISVTTLYDKSSGNVMVKVKDKGVGITKEAAEKIFDPFYTTKRNSGGTGLGLSVSFNILKNHNGSLSFNSKPKEGTTALMLIPSNVNRKT